MRILLLIFILTLKTIGYGQNYEVVVTENEKFFKLIGDSIKPSKDYPDGRYKIFKTDTNKFPKHVFYLKDGSVEGPYLKLTPGGWKYGNYTNDSLWTFLTSSEDTTFKIGTWRHYANVLGSAFDDEYKMQYDSSGKFTEVWRFHNGRLAREATFKKGFGLIKETYWDFETNEISKQTINSGTKNYYQSVVYKNDSISYVLLNQNGIQIVVNFDYMPNFCSNSPCLDIAVYSDNWERTDLPMATMSIDSSKTLTEFRDVKRQVFMSEEEDGNIDIMYQNNKGKQKSKKLKIK